MLDERKERDMTQIDYGLEIKTVALAVNDLDDVTAFYKTTVGLDVLHKDGEQALLGADGTPLLELQKDSQARQQPNAPGLYHTAFLLPQRSDLASWVSMASQQNVYADGASDHGMSEAIYLTDPEGNGVEIYADRPQDVWLGEDVSVKGGGGRIDFDDLMKRATHWNGAPKGTKIGHVHLQVGDLGEAHEFFGGELGLNVRTQMPGMAFFAAGLYHHHFGTNTYRSAGLTKPNRPATGLRRIDLEFADTQGLPDQIEAVWGTEFVIKSRDALAA